MNVVNAERVRLLFTCLLRGDSIRSACKTAYVSKATTPYWFAILSDVHEECHEGHGVRGRKILDHMVQCEGTTVEFFVDFIMGWHDVGRRA